jgi:hypothetical protein
VAGRPDHTFAAHQLGAATAAWATGAVRTAAHSYQPAFMSAGFLGVLAALMVLGVGTARRPGVPAAEPV